METLLTLTTEEISCKRVDCSADRNSCDSQESVSDEFRKNSINSIMILRQIIMFNIIKERRMKTFMKMGLLAVLMISMSWKGSLIVNPENSSGAQLLASGKEEKKKEGKEKKEEKKKEEKKEKKKGK